MRRFLTILLILSVHFSFGQDDYNGWRHRRYLQDNFTDANNTSLTSHTMDVGSGWTFSLDGNSCSVTSDIRIQSNRAVAEPGVWFIATSDASHSDVVMSADLIVPNLSNYVGGLVVRYTDCANYIFVVIERDGGGTPYMAIYKVEAGSFSSITSVNVPAATNSTLHVTVTCSGNSITALAGTGENCNTSTSFNNTATKFGLWADDNGAYTPAIPIDNFLVTN